MASELGRFLSDLIRQCLPLTRRQATPNPSPLPSSVHDNTIPMRVISARAAPPSRAATPGVVGATPQTVETSLAITALKVVLGGLSDKLNELPPLQVAVRVLLECITGLQLDERNRQEYDELALDLANLATTLQKHVVESKPHDGPYSIANVVRSIGEQTQLIQGRQDQSRIGRLATAKDDEEAVLKCYRRIGALFQQLQTDIILSVWDDSKQRDMDTRLKDLCPAYDAYYDAALPTSATKRAGCTHDTRAELLETTQDWARDENAPKIFWLNGMAGTGKTTIAYTLCEMLQEARQLGASFFCSRNSPDCRDINRIVPTIAYQLGRYSNPFRQALCDALKSDPDASKRNIGTQFECLIVKPFAERGQAMPKDVIVVIDALDECTDEAGTKDALNVLARHAANLPIKFFVASRPEPAICKSMAACDGAPRSIFRLHDIEKSLVQADIALYLTEALRSIPVSPFEINQLAARAGNLFIFAATAVRYITPGTGTVNNRKRLQEVLALQPNQKSRSYRDIDNLYATILANALDEETYNKDEIITRQQVLWTAICAREPLTMAALAEMLHVLDDEDVRLAVEPLQSVLHVSESSRVVSALHASFPDFLLASERAGKFYCDGVVQNSHLTECCFGLMGRSLKFNICGLGSSYVLDKDVPNIQCRIDEAISTGLFYSCRYWGDHIASSPPSATSLSLLHTFLQQHLLFWMEVLNLKGWIGHGDVVLSQALTWLSIEDEWTGLRDFVCDARNFLTVYASNPTSLSTPHIYVSALPFTSQESHVRTAYWKRTRGLIKIEGAAAQGRRNTALATWVIGGDVNSITRSSDGRRVASGSDKNEVRVWDVSSGVCVLGPLRGHNDEVRSVAFSPDDFHIASGSDDCTIRVWNTHDGSRVLGPLCGHTAGVFSIAFSPDGTHLASGSGDRTVRVWDAFTGAARGDAYEGHQGARPYDSSSELADRCGSSGTNKGAYQAGELYCVLPDGRRLVSGSEDGTVRVWDVSSGMLMASPFEGHTGGVMSVSFSPNGTQLVSGSVDGTICVWEAESGKVLAGPFEGHRSPIDEVLFTTDGTRILSGSWDGTIRVWDARQGATSQAKLFGHSAGIDSVAMSPDGTRAASGSRDRAVCVWDTHNGALIAGPFKGHTEAVEVVMFSPDGARIVSGSYDHTLRTWDASTGTLLAGPFRGHSNLVTSVAFSPDGSRIASGSYDKTLRLWDSHTGKPAIEPFEDHTSTITSIAFSPDGACIVSGSWDARVRMWDASDGTVVWRFSHTRVVHCVAFSPDGTRVVSGSDDHAILVLDPRDGTVLHRPFTGHSERVSSVAFSPDGTRVVSGSEDKTVCVWDVESGAVVVGPLKGHTMEVTSVAFCPDGAHVISASADSTIRFWDVVAATQPDTTSFNRWSIADDGWLTDSRSQRLFWVPADLRRGFWLPTPSNPLVSNAHSTTRVDNTTLLGERWCACYGRFL